ncbi:MAG: TRAP transporter small permease [Chloroflexi bacterium]|nr:TRAP transporter small permease [Chloroflexota bacterium]
MGKTIDWIDRAIGVIGMLLGSFSAVLIALIAIITTVEVIARKMGYPTGRAHELGEVAMVAVAFLGAAWAERYRAHIFVEFFVERFPKRVQTYIDVFNSLLGLFFCATVAWYGWRLASRSFTLKSTIPAGWLPKFIPELALFIGMSLLGIEYILRIVRTIQTGSPPLTEATAMFAAHREDT